MRSTVNYRQTAGFTLVEMLIVAPLVLLFIGGIIALMLSLVGDVTVASERNKTVATIQSALDTIERDITIGFALNQTTGTLPNRQGVSSGTGAFGRNSSTLIVAQYATIANPYDADRILAFVKNSPNPCNTAITYLNTIVTTQIIYFVQNSTLYRRVTVPLAYAGANAVCGNGAADGTVWQKNSCAAINEDVHCVSRDEKLLEGVSAINIQYYDYVDTEPTTARISLTASRSIAGTSFTSSGAIRASVINNK